MNLLKPFNKLNCSGELKFDLFNKLRLHFLIIKIGVRLGILNFVSFRYIVLVPISTINYPIKTQNPGLSWLSSYTVGEFFQNPNFLAEYVRPY